MAKARPKRALTALKSAAKTIEYEFCQLIDSGALLGTGTQAQRNAALESFLLHARNLRDFFRKSGGDDDIIASDFTRTPAQVSMPYVRSQLINKRLNKLLAHPSYKRPALRKKHWEPSRLAVELTRAMHQFLAQLDEGFRHRPRPLDLGPEASPPATGPPY